MKQVRERDIKSIDDVIPTKQKIFGQKLIQVLAQKVAKLQK